MVDFGYHTDEYVTENEIDNFLKCLQLEWLIKEHQAVREFIRGILIDNLPVPNRAIKVTTIGEIPTGVVQLPIFSGSNRTKEFGFDVRYQTYQTYQTPAPDSSKFKQRQIGDHHVYGGYNAGIKEFVISVRFNNYNKFQDNSENARTSILNSKKETIQPRKETSVTEENKDQCEATKHGPTLTVEEITGILIDLGVSENDVKESFFHLPTKLAIGKLPNVTIHRVDDKITLTYGNTEKAILLDKAAAQDARLPDSMRLSPEEIRYEAFDDVVNQSGLYIYTASPKEETKMLYPPKTTIQILKPIYRDRLQKAGLSDEAVQFISDEIFHGSALKAPKEDSSFVITAGKDVLNVYYSHDNKSITLTDIETTKTTSSGEVVSYSTGTRCAFFVVDTSNTQEKLIQQHVGEPTLTLNLGNGRSVNIPFKKEYLGFDKDYVITQITADFSMVTTNGGLNNLDGPALVDETGTAPYRFFANSQEYTAEELTKKVEQWTAEGIVKPKTPESLKDILNRHKV